MISMAHRRVTLRRSKRRGVGKEDRDLRQRPGDDENVKPTARAVQTTGIFAHTVKAKNLHNSVVKLSNCVIRTTSSYPRTFSIIWDLTMERLSSENCVSPALHILRILAYCDPDRTKMNDLRHIYCASLPEDDAKHFGKETFDLVVEKLEQLSLVSKYTKGCWMILPDSCFRMSKFVQKMVRRDDTDKVGLQSILLSDKPFAALNYMACEPGLTIPQSILRDEPLTDRWLLCFSYALRQAHNFPFYTAMRLKFNSGTDKEQLQTSMRPDTLAAVEFIQKIEMEKNVAALYLAAVEFAKENPTSALHHLAEFCAFKCWTNHLFSCNPLVYPLFTVIAAVCPIAAASWIFLLYACWAGVALTMTPVFFWLFMFPKLYFWFRTLVGMRNYKDNTIGILGAALASMYCIFVVLLL